MNVDDVIQTADDPTTNGGFAHGELLESWASVGRWSERLLLDPDLSPEQRSGIEEVRRGALKIVAALDERS